MHLIFLRILRKIGLLSKLVLSSKLKLEEKNYTIPIINGLGINNLMMDELWMIELFKLLKISSNKYLIDVGANVGQTLLKWKAVYPESACYCFEPHHECVSYLNKLVSSNNINDCVIINAALWNEEKTTFLNLHFDELGDRSASLVPTKFDIKNSIKINAMSFKYFIQEQKIDINKIGVIKIDVEGAEFIILKEINSILMKHKICVIIEILSEQDKAQLVKINNLINTLPYDWFRIKKSGYHFSHLEKIHAIAENTKIINSDYILIPHNQDISDLFYKND